MLDFHEKRKLKSYVYSKPTIVVLLLFALLLSTAVYERYSREREMAEKRDALASELEHLQQQASVLDAEVNRLKSERGMEEEIRDRFDVSRPGEEIVIIVEDEEKNATVTSTSPTGTNATGFFGRWWR